MFIESYYPFRRDNSKMLLLVMTMFCFSISYAADSTGQYFVCFKFSAVTVENKQTKHELQLGIVHHLGQNDKGADQLEYYPLHYDHPIIQDHENQRLRNIGILFFGINRAVKQGDDEKIVKEMENLNIILDFDTMKKNEGYLPMMTLDNAFVPNQKFEYRKSEYFPMNDDFSCETEILDQYYFKYRLDKRYEPLTAIKLYWLYAQAYLGRGTTFDDLHQVLEGMIDNRFSTRAPYENGQFMEMHSTILARMNIKNHIGTYENGQFMETAIFSAIAKNKPIELAAVKEEFQRICNETKLRIVRPEYQKIMDADTFLDNFVDVASEVHTIEYVSEQFTQERYKFPMYLLKTKGKFSFKI